MPRLVRRAPLSERLKAYLDPWDWLLWISEELNSDELEDLLKAWALPLGVFVNILFLICRANSGSVESSGNDVWGDYESKRGSGWLTWFCTFVVQFLSLLSVVNAFYTFTRKRHYRLFEQSVDAPPSTPSAHRVRVDSSPASSSPLRFLSNIIASATAESRAHPDATRDVWEIAVWDPTPICLQLFCLFSPGHVLVYWLFLPLRPLDPRPSVTVVTTIALAVLLSVQLSFLQSFFSQQAKDSALIHKEVLHEYDTKYVHPALNRPARDVGTQTPPSLTKSAHHMTTTEVDTYTPHTIIKREFHPNPNPAYASQYDPDNALKQPPSQRAPRPTTTSLFTPTTNGYTPSRGASPEKAADLSSPIRAPTNAFPKPPGSAFRQTLVQKPRKSDIGTSTGDGGSLGVYSHAASPLRKAASTNYLRQGESADGRRREGSPLKRMSTTGFEDGRGVGGAPLNQRFRDLRGDGRRESGRF